MTEVKLYNQDCIVAMKEIGGSSVDLIVTDPPYNLGNFMKNRDTNLQKMRDNFFGSAGWDDLEFEEWEEAMNDFFKESARVLKKRGVSDCFHGYYKSGNHYSTCRKTRILL